MSHDQLNTIQFILVPHILFNTFVFWNKLIICDKYACQKIISAFALATKQFYNAVSKSVGVQDCCSRTWIKNELVHI